MPQPSHPDAGSASSALQSILRTIAETFGWEAALYWIRDPGEERLRCTDTWSAPGAAQQFLEASRPLRLASGDHSLPGRVWHTRAPASVEDLLREPHSERRDAALAAGMRGATAFPVLDGRALTGVVEFLGRLPQSPNAGLARAAALLGRLTGQLLGRERAEAELRQSRARLQGIVDSASEAIIMVDEAQRIVLFNPAAEHIFRCAAADALGTSLGQLVPKRYRAAHAGYVRDFAQGLTLGRARHAVTTTGLRADGEEFPAEATYSRLTQNGTTLLTVILRDITKRVRAERRLRESEAQLRVITDNVPAMIGHVDAHGRVRFANASYAALVGSRPDELVGRQLRDIVPAQHRAATTAHIEAALAGHSVSYKREHRTADGDIRSLEVAFVPDRLEDGTVRGFYSFARDITERKRAEDT
ncbi:MAG: PAS domain S-box protein, partial [Betaproteobacteria bacterium]|nr:PAS domain S-box protein [Betaproteobacteria bacterium]